MALEEAWFQKVAEGTDTADFLGFAEQAKAYNIEIIQAPSRKRRGTLNRRTHAQRRFAKHLSQGVRHADAGDQRRHDAGDIDKWDSLTHINLIVEVEKTFGTKFRNGEIARLQCVGDLKRLVKKYKPALA